MPAIGSRRLPIEVRFYFDAVKAKDVDALAKCFAPEAVVIDINRRITGVAAIRRWAGDEVVGGIYEVLDVTEDEGRVTILLTFAPRGAESFKARYEVDLRHGKIVRMNLQYA